jgi:hypothetical protein
MEGLTEKIDFYDFTFTGNARYLSESSFYTTANPSKNQIF